MNKKFRDSIKYFDSKFSIRIIFSNFLSLFTLQLVNILLPLVTFPYLVKVLEIEKFGLLIFSQSLVSYFLILTEYGFNLSGTRKISLCLGNKSKISNSFNGILQAKILLALISTLLVIGIVYSVEKLYEERLLYIFSFSIVIGNVMFPTWFFQGIEKMKQITILNFISKIIFTLLILFLVKKPDDYLLVPLIQSFGFLTSGIIALILVFNVYKIKFHIVSINEIYNELKDGFNIFLSNLSTNIYSASSVVILGFVSSDAIVGKYGIAEKLIRIITSMFYPLSQAIYPRIVQLASNKNKRLAIDFLKIVYKIVVVFSIISLILSLILSEIFLKFLIDEIDLSKTVFNTLSPLLIIIPLSILLFHNTLLPFKLDKYYLRVYLTGALSNMFLLYLLVIYFEQGVIGAAYSLLISEILVIILAAKIFYRKVLKIKTKEN